MAAKMILSSSASATRSQMLDDLIMGVSLLHAALE